MPKRSTVTPLSFCVLRSLACAAMVSACTEAHDLDAPMTGMDASVPSAEAGTMDAQPAVDIDARVSRDAGGDLDSALPPDASSLCRVPSRAACGIGDKRSVAGRIRGSRPEDALITVCEGNLPVLCDDYWAPKEDAGLPRQHCAAGITSCWSSAYGAYECDDTSDCPQGQVCGGPWAGKPFGRASHLVCKPDCVDHGPGHVQACSQDCECGSGTCTMPGGYCARDSAPWHYTAGPWDGPR